MTLLNLNDYSFENVKKDGVEWTTVNIDGGVNISRKGAAELPFFEVKVMIPGDDYRFEVRQSMLI